MFERNGALFVRLFNASGDGKPQELSYGFESAGLTEIALKSEHPIRATATTMQRNLVAMSKMRLASLLVTKRLPVDLRQGLPPWELAQFQIGEESVAYHHGVRPLGLRHCIRSSRSSDAKCVTRGSHRSRRPGSHALGRVAVVL